ncbi:MAG: glycosyltransferase [Planctomycetaceae bacterium]|nr:glycosyltransferase [Planctomycetaceae bacterium]
MTDGSKPPPRSWMVLRACWRWAQRRLPYGWAEWLLSSGLYLMDKRHLRRKTRAEAHGEAGVTLVGYFDDETGLGESARQLREAITVAGISHNTLTIQSRGKSFLHLEERPELRQTVLWHLNGHIAAAMMHKLGAGTVASRCNIGCWMWEVEEFPYFWQPALRYLDELWTFSNFNLECFRRAAGSEMPVRLLPQPVTVHPEEGDWRQFFSLPRDRVVCLVVFDFGSNIVRKNPFAAIKAAKIADAQLGGGALHLVVKTSRGENHPEENAELRDALQGIDHTHITTILPRRELTGLYQACDILLSLHRSEGFGLVPAECMALGKPVVATDWSATTDFVTHDTAWPVRYRLVTTTERSGYYRAGTRWAEADIDDAAAQILDIIHNPDHATIKTEAAQRFMDERYSVTAVANALTDWIADTPASKQ